MVGLANPPYSLQGKKRQSPRVEPPDSEDNPGTWHRQSLGGKAGPLLHTRHIHVKQHNMSQGPLTPPPPHN